MGTTDDNGRVAGALFAVSLLAACVACGPDAGAARVHVVAAASLRGVLSDLADRYEARNPGVRVRLRTGGSNALSRRVLELDLEADVLFLADAGLFSELLQPDWTSAWVPYAADRMVLAYTDASAGAGEIGPANWVEVITRPGVDVGIADPDLAPVGYRALLTLRLADLARPGTRIEERVLARVGERNLRPDVAELLAPLQAGALDYAFLYGATAEAAGLRHVDLPDAVDLGSPDLERHYARVAVEVAGRGPEAGQRILRRGEPILYGAALPGDDPGAAAGLGFLSLSLSPAGREALRAHGFTPVAPERHRFRGPGAESLRRALAGADGGRRPAPGSPQ